MAPPTHDEILLLVRKRFPNLEASMQAEITAHAFQVLAEPHWAKRINWILAVKIAAHRVQRPSIAAVQST